MIINIKKLIVLCVLLVSQPLFAANNSVNSLASGAELELSAEEEKRYRQIVGAMKKAEKKHTKQQNLYRNELVDLVAELRQELISLRDSGLSDKQAVKAAKKDIKVLAQELKQLYRMAREKRAEHKDKQGSGEMGKARLSSLLGDINQAINTESPELLDQVIARLEIKKTEVSPTVSIMAVPEDESPESESP